MDSVLKQMTQRHTHSYPHGGVKNKAFATQKTRINTKKNKINKTRGRGNLTLSILLVGLITVTPWFDGRRMRLMDHFLRVVV